MPQAFSNRASTLLTSPLGAASTVAVLALGEGDKFPSTAGGRTFKVVIEDRRTGQFEICNCTSRTGDQFNLQRGVEGTIPISWQPGAIFSHRITAEVHTELEARLASGDQSTAALAARVAALEAAANNYQIPVGGLYLSTVNANPSQALGYGTWVAHAAGRALVGVGNNGQFNWAAGQERGSETHTLTEAQLPAHNHSVDPPSTTTSSAGAHTHNTTDFLYISDASQFGIDLNGASQADRRAGNQVIQSAGAHTHSVNIPAFNSGNKGGGQAHNNVQPSIAVFVWRRTA